MPFRVNHNGTEDWIEAPLGTTRDEHGGVVFATLEEASKFAADVARDCIDFFRHEGNTYEQTLKMLRDVPVQTIEAGADRVVRQVDAQRANIGYALEVGEEDVVRNLYGDEAVTAVIRADLEAEGYDFDAVCEGANGYERPLVDRPAEGTR